MFVFLPQKLRDPKDIHICELLKVYYYFLAKSELISGLNQLHAVSRTQQGRQSKPRGKALRSALSAQFWRHCVLSGGTQRRYADNNGLLTFFVKQQKKNVLIIVKQNNSMYE